MRAPWRSPFNPDRDLVVRRAFTHAGVKVAVGSKVEKTEFTTRRLRQLYDQRVIIFAGDAPGARKRARSGVSVGDGAPDGGGAVLDSGAPAIPADWRTLNFFAKKALASKFTLEPIKNGGDATAAIEAELIRRGHS